MKRLGLRGKVMGLVITEFVVLTLAVAMVGMVASYEVQFRQITKTMRHDLLYTLSEVQEKGTEWSLRGNAIYIGEKLVGDGTEEGMDGVRDDLVRLEEETGDWIDIYRYQDGMFISVAASTTVWLNGESYLGIEKEQAIVEEMMDTDEIYLLRTTDLDGNYYSMVKNLFDADGNLIGVIMASQGLHEIRMAILNNVAPQLLAAIIMVWLPILATHFATKKWLVDLERTKEYLATVKLTQLPKEYLKVDANDEIGEIADSVNEMVRSLKRDQRVVNEVNTASGVQAAMLPFPMLDDVRIDTYCKMTPAKEVGGDFYNLFKLDKDHLGFFVGDVSGKGVPAAILMAVGNSALKSSLMATKNPATALMTANHLLSQQGGGYFVTAFVGVLNLETGALKYANAGHNLPMILGKNNRILDAHQNLILGVTDNYEFKNQKTTLEEGERILVYTDGINESINDSSEQYGEERIMKFCEKNRALNTLDLTERLFEDVYRFAENQEQFDDMTVLLVERKRSKHLTVSADVQNLDCVQEFITKNLPKMDAGEVNKIQVAVEELFINVATYGGRPNLEVCFDVRVRNGNLEIKMIDNGVRFDPLKRRAPDLEAGIDERDIGGLGIYLVKECFDKVVYNYINNKNVLFLEKEIK